MAGQARKLTYMDGLRGFAAFIVVIHHYACAFFPIAIWGAAPVIHSRYEFIVYNTPLSLLVAGNFAVCIFFVLSGFVLVHKFFLTGDSEAIRSSAARRYFRLMPPVFVVVLAAFVMIRLGWFQNHGLSALTGSGWLEAAWSQPVHLLGTLKFGLYGAFTTGTRFGNYNDVLWTMSIEFIGSFLVLGTALLFGRMRQRWIVYLLLVLILWRTYYPAFVIGLALSDVVANRAYWQRASSRLWGWPVLAIGLYFGSVSRPLGGALTAGLSRDAILALFHIAGAGLLVMAILLLHPIRRFLDTRPLQYLGKLSFSMYLTHLLVLGSLGCLIFTNTYPTLGYIGAVAASAIICLPIMIFFADRLTLLADQPAIKLSHKFYQQFFHPHPPQPAPPIPAPTVAGVSYSSKV